MAKSINIKKDAIAKAVKSFKGLEHRLEFVGTKNKTYYYNDSFATTPESTITALRSFDQPIILLAGGAEKESNFNSLAQEINKKVKYLILFSGEASPRLKKKVLEKGFSKNKIIIVSGMKEAVHKAQEKSCPGEVVLMSTACDSFGMFNNYKERGNLFKQAAKEI